MLFSLHYSIKHSNALSPHETSFHSNGFLKLNTAKGIKTFAFKNIFFKYHAILSTSYSVFVFDSRNTFNFVSFQNLSWLYQGSSVGLHKFLKLLVILNKINKEKSPGI